MTQPAKAQEPSMEEILASIRRIIADDDVSKSSPHDAPKPAASGEMPAAAPAALSLAASQPRSPPPAIDAVAAARDETADILDLTESMASAAPSSAPAAPQFRTIDGDSDIGFDEVAERPAPRSIVERPTQLLSKETSAAVDSSFNTLAQTVLIQNARTLEDLVREMLRPMLKSWLDDNLPGVVERMVRAEIERVSRGRMG